jgi:hypothetical protein
LPRELLERLLSFTVAHLHASSSIVGAGAVPSGRLPSLAPPVLPTITLKVIHPGTSTSAATSFTARFSLDTPLSDFSSPSTPDSPVPVVTCHSSRTPSSATGDGWPATIAPSPTTT